MVCSATPPWIVGCAPAKIDFRLKSGVRAVKMARFGLVALRSRGAALFTVGLGLLAACHGSGSAGASAAARQYTDDGPDTLDASLRIVNGDETIADSEQGEDAMCRQFEAWVAARYALPG